MKYHLFGVGESGYAGVGLSDYLGSRKAIDQAIVAAKNFLEFPNILELQGVQIVYSGPHGLVLKQEVRKGEDENS